MKPLPWAKSALALCIMGTLTACGGGGSSSAGEGDIADLPEPPPVVVVPPEESGIINTPLPLVENFGEYTSFDQSDVIDFFSPNYKSLASVGNSEYVDERPSLYYPTCCFFDQEDPNGEITVDHVTRLGIVSDGGDPSLLISNARFTIGQTKSDMADSSKLDPKKDSTPGTDGGSGWGELDLSEPYRISFCVSSATGSGSMTQIYVNNNTTGEANSIHGGGGTGSRIFNVETGSLIPGKRVEINVPGNITLQPGAEAVDIKTQQVGTEKSFLHLRVSNGGTAIIDDLLIEKQTENGQAELPACSVFQPAVAPEAPAAPGAVVGDSYIQTGWASVFSATSYELAYNTVDSIEGAIIVPAAEITGTSYTLEGLENGTNYYLFVRASNSVGASDWSASTMATPVAPVGEACAPTSQVTTAIAWSVYDGCRSPSDEASVIYNTSTPTKFDFGSSDATMFKAVANEKGENLGRAKLDTTADVNARSRGEIFEVFDAGYPKHFTAIARAKADSSTQRGFEFQTYFAEAGKRVNMQLRPDKGQVILEKFTAGATDVTADVPMTDGKYHIYHVAFTMTDADTLAVKVYVDGSDVPLIDQTSTGRDDTGNANKFRIGEDASSAHLAEIDWIIWSTDAATAALKPSELLDQLPDTMGELGKYSSAASVSSWTGMELDMAGSSGTALEGEIISSDEDNITIRASGGSASSDSLRHFFAYQEVTGPFTFTAKLASVKAKDDTFVTSSNSYRFGIAVMDSVDVPVDGNFQSIGRFATVDYWVSDVSAPAFSGSRAHKLDVGDTSESKRSRSNADIAIGDLIRIEVIDESGTPRVIRSVSKDNGATFTQLNSSAFKDDGAAGFKNTWFVGVYGAPGDELTLEFTDISITQPE